MKIDVSVESFEEAMVRELHWQYQNMAPGKQPPMFSFDPEEDEREFRKLRKAFKRVLNYYGCKV